MRCYFCGWYFKCQSDQQTLAVIPALHRSKEKSSCSVQIITDKGAWNASFPYDYFHKSKKDFHILAGGNYFGTEGISLCLQTEACSAVGAVRFGAFSPIRYDIMGPFRYVPLMECRHSVLSMRHTVTGNIRVNGTDYHFQDDTGYIEGDRGYSFPKEYAWTQCSFAEGSLMLSAADIPLGRFHFIGVISVICWRGKEYRLATYLGAKIEKIGQGEIVIRQGSLVLSAKLMEKHACPLLAPVSGTMSRTIHESASCRAAFCLKQDGQTLFSFETTKASFEYEYPY